MAITLVASVTAGPGVNGGATAAIDTTGATLLVISAHWWTGGGPGPITVSDSKGNTWTGLMAHIGVDIRHQFSYCLSPAVGSSHTLTFSAANTYPAIIAYAFAGVGSYQTEEGVGGTTSGSLAAGSAVTPSANGALVLTGFAPNPAPGTTTVAPVGFTLTTKAGVGGVNFDGSAAHYVQPTAAPITPIWSWTAGLINVALSTAVFLPATAAAVERVDTYVWGAAMTVLTLTAPALTAARTLTTMLIRTASDADVPRLVALGRAQLAASYGDLATTQLEALVRQLLAVPHGAVFVAERDETVVGMIWLLLTVHHVSGVPTACEVSWYVDPAARGAGLALLKRAERWAAEIGADQIQMVAPATDQGARVGRLYEHRGYRPLETSYQAPVRPAMAAITVIDDALPDFPAYLTAARRAAYRPVETATGAVFHGIAAPPDDTVTAGITTRWPSLTPTLSVLRLSPAGQVEPHFIHVDTDMGDWTAILYLTEAPPEGDGTTFWRQRATGALAATAALAQPVPFEDLGQWEPWTTIPARPNRLVIFPACYFHSRALAENYGIGDTARLIAVTFGTGAWPPAGGA